MKINKKNIFMLMDWMNKYYNGLSFQQDPLENIFASSDL